MLIRIVVVGFLTLLLCQWVDAGQERKAAVDGAGDALPAGAIARLGTLRWRHDGTVTTLAYSPDGSILAGSCAGKIILWEAATGKRIRQLPIGSAGWLSRHCLDFSPDGKLLAVAHREYGGSLIHEKFSGKITFWEVTTGKHVRNLEAPGGSPSDLRFSPDGKSLAVSDGHNLFLRDAKTGKERWHSNLKETFVFDFVFSPDSKILAVIAHKEESEAYLLDAATGELLTTLEHPKNTGISGLAFSRDGKSIATTSSKRAYLWNVATGKEETSLESEMQGSTGLAFTPDGKTLLASDWDTRVYVWDLEKKKLRYRLGRALFAGGRAVLSPDGKTFAVGTAYSQIHLWNVATGAERFTEIAGHDYFVRSLAFSPDGRLLASGGDLGQTRLWDTKSWTLARSLNSNAQMLSFTPDGKQLAVVPFTPTHFSTHSSSAKNKPMSIWDVAKRKEIATFPEQGHNVFWGSFAEGGKRLVAFDGKVSVWDVATRKRTAQSEFLTAGPFALGAQPRLNGLPILTPDGKTVLLSITTDGGVRNTKTRLHAIDLDNGQERFAFPDIHGPIALSADGKTLASGGSRGVRLWELGRKEITGLDPDFGKHQRDVSALAFSPNGRLLASAAGFPQHMGDVPDTPHIRLWDVKTGKQVASFRGDGGFISSLAFSPDGTRLVSGMWNGSILVWDIAKLTDK